MTQINPNKIVLFAKRPGRTSFSSLFTIKHAFNTRKVGHTGTLDSFASGLLVVCAGALTRLAGKITEFDKTYQAVIKLGQETDTLECTGKVIREAELPTLQAFQAAVKKYCGSLKQVPPAFSAIHIDGRRASDLVRSGKTLEIPCREITVFSSEILETKLTADGKVQAARVEFSVSKGTYIRSLARDICAECGSAGYLMGLLRTKVGNFKLEDAAGYDLLEDFTIENAYKMAEETITIEKKNQENKKNHVHENHVTDGMELILQKQVIEKSVGMSRNFAEQCGFAALVIKDEKLPLFENGAKLHSDFFDKNPFDLREDFAAVFTTSGNFAGLLQKNEQGYFGYAFVVH